MKKILLFFSLLLLLSNCKSKSKTVENKVEIQTDARISLADADPVQKQRAYEFGKRVLDACNTSRFKAFNESEATPTVIKNTTEARITKTCHIFRQRYGKFKDLLLVEIVHNKKEETNVYRYKANYEKKIANKELRVIMNKENKIVAIKSTDWEENYKPLE